MNERECCGTCSWKLRAHGEWTCGNNESDYYGLETEYGFDECEEWEGKEDGRKH